MIVVIIMTVVVIIMIIIVVIVIVIICKGPDNSPPLPLSNPSHANNQLTVAAGLFASP